MKHFNSIARPLIFSVLFVLSGIQLMAVPMIRLKMNGFSGYLDETVMYYQAGATAGFDASYDSYFLAGPNPAPHIAQQCNSVLMAINGVEPVSQSFSMSIKATTHLTGNFTITAMDFEELPAGTCVSLKDLATGNITNLLAGPYSFLLQDTTSSARFVLTVTNYSLSFASGLTQPTCQFSNGGSCKVTGASNGPWNCTWKDSSGSIVKTSLDISGSDSLYNLSSGNYVVEMMSANACSSNDTSFTFTIQPVILPVVSFTSSDTITAGLQNLEPTNQSAGSIGYAWDFGDGTGSSDNFEPSYSYQATGLYQVKLTGFSPTGCADSMYRSVVVIGLATHIKKELGRSATFADMGNRQYRIVLNRNFSSELGISLLALDGKTLLQRSHAPDGNGEIDLDLDAFKTGVYTLSIRYGDIVVLSRKVVVR